MYDLELLLECNSNQIWWSRRQAMPVHRIQTRASEILTGTNVVLHGIHFLKTTLISSKDLQRVFSPSGKKKQVLEVISTLFEAIQLR
jgi:hypothetical protein